MHVHPAPDRRAPIKMAMFIDVLRPNVSMGQLPTGVANARSPGVHVASRWVRHNRHVQTAGAGMSSSRERSDDHPSASVDRSASGASRSEMEQRTAAVVDRILAEARAEAERVLDLVRCLEPSRGELRASVVGRTRAHCGDAVASPNAAPMAMNQVAVSDPIPDVMHVEGRTPPGITVAEWYGAVAPPDERGGASSRRDARRAGLASDDR